ncbi:mannosyl-oligosaccharide glucosidase [Trypanosoma grayi]|uniref:mannosyl-oligosaccharide glucosidase n=1 Tax=Trypanosoma grayi TaxID=71804 RepID=UPI0004F4A10A|nr:mannosyl-oligosaccharide glucosidase [Trypanosoma grayi]KEG13080.1 mannosyl-oligosaccharide glucosidase [Trypanosoma grayi]
MAPIAADSKRRSRARKEQIPRLTFKEILLRVLFFLVVLGVPLWMIYSFTPFFVVQRLQCRAVEKLWGDATVRAMEDGYHRYEASPPRFPSLEYNKTMMWGTYEPGLLFAMKTRTPKPVYIGIGWYDEAGMRPVRHKMADVLSLEGRRDDTNEEVISDEKSSDFEAWWTVHDGVHYGRQYVRDGICKVNIEFLKSPSGDTWHLRVHSQMDGAKPMVFVVYVVNEGGDGIEPEAAADAGDSSWNPQIRSEYEDAEGRREGFTLLLRDDHNPFFTPPLWKAHGWHAAAGEFLRDVDLRSVPSSAHLYASEHVGGEHWKGPPSGTAAHNVMVFRKRYESDFRIELSMRHASHLIVDGQDATAHHSFVPTYDALTTCQLTNAFRQREKGVLQRMRQMVSSGANGFRAHRKLYINRARRVLSGALGSWGFWRGRYLYANPNIDALWDNQGKAAAVQSDDQLQEATYDVSAFGAVPSRVDVTHGDLTLTGMQLLFMLRWNKEWVKESIASWLVDTQNQSDGFIPRRAVFTQESRSFTVPSARYEHLTFTEAPTILLPIRELLREDQGGTTQKAFFEMVLPPLRRWRTWFHTTQSSSSNPASLEALAVASTGGASASAEGDGAHAPPMYRWRSRDDYRITTSGMPDYPRPVCDGHHTKEAHVDLFSWVALLSTTISDIERHLGLAESIPKHLWIKWLDEAHWDSDNQRYADRVGCPGRPFSPYVGYANLYPFILGLLDDNARAHTVLDLIKSDLMTPYGVMSVSYDAVRTARTAGLRHDNRWMGHVWVPVNALLLHTLRSKYVARLGAPAEELFQRLRLSVVEAAGGSHTMAEALNPVTGAAESTASLVGYRALLLLLMEQYD